MLEEELKDNTEYEIDEHYNIRNGLEAKEFIYNLSVELMLLMQEDLEKDLKTYKINPYKNVNLLSSRQSALVWAFVPGEGINELFTFDEVCRRLSYVPDEIRVQLFKYMTRH